MSPIGDRTARTLFLMRHAQAASFVADGGDRARELTSLGHAQARELGTLLARADIERVLCSPAARTRQTAESLGLRAGITVLDALYNCPPGRIATELSTLPEYVHRVLVVGHYPGIPNLVQGLADRTSDPSALRLLGRQFPPGSLAELEFHGPWSELHSARLVIVRKP